MRTTSVLAAVMCTSALFLGACATPEHQSGDAAPAGAASAPTTPAAAGTTAAATPSATPSATSGAASGATSDALVLGPAGLGALKLGMTPSQAAGTGMLASVPNSAAGCVVTDLKASGGAAGSVEFSPTLGLMAINAQGAGMNTAEGVHLGMSRDDMKQKYKDWQIIDSGQSDGRGYAKVPGNATATYRIATKKGKVSELTLQLAKQDCYE